MKRREIKAILMSMRTSENDEIVNKLLGKIDMMDDISLQKAVEQVGGTEEAVRNFFEKKINERQNDNTQEHTPINEMFSYGISGGCIHLHLPTDLHQMISQKGISGTIDTVNLYLLDAIDRIKNLKDEGYHKLQERDSIYMISPILLGRELKFLKGLDFETRIYTKKELSKEFGKSLSTFSNMELENVVYTILQGKNKKIAVGESITGGKIAEKLVSVPGISAFFNEGAVCYTNASKISRLFVLPETLGKFGAVSEQTAREMCEGLLTNPMNDIAISTTGFAGPKSKNGKEPVGKCFIGIGTKGNIKVFEHVFHGDRNTVRETCAKYALFYLINLLKYNEL